MGRKRDIKHRTPRSAEDRAKWAAERRALEGSLIAQSDMFEGAMVVSHIRGSQYLVRLSDGSEVYASHKKDKDQNRNSHFSYSGWKLWEDRG